MADFELHAWRVGCWSVGQLGSGVGDAIPPPTTHVGLLTRTASRAQAGRQVGRQAGRDRMAAAAAGSGREQPSLYHLVQASMWEAAVREQETYYPPTYAKVRFGGWGE